MYSKFNRDTWDYRIEGYKAKAIEKNIKKDLIENIQFLQEELGKGFFKNCGRNHPIDLRLAQWPYLDIINFINKIIDIKTLDCNYSKLIKKLKSHSDSRREAIPFIDISHTFYSNGFQVKFLNEGDVRTPDIEVINIDNNDKLFVEVTMLETSQINKIISSNYYTLSNEFNKETPILPYSCVQKNIFSKKEASEILNKIRTIKNEVERGKKFDYYKDGNVQFVIGNDEKTVKNWCCKNKMEYTEVRGLPEDTEYLKRILKINKIKEKAEQFTNHGNGIIYIHFDFKYFLLKIENRDIKSFLYDIQLLENEVKKFPNLIGVVFYSYISDECKEASVILNKHYYGMKMTEDGRIRDLLFIYNHKCNLTISKETLDKIYETFK